MLGVLPSCVEVRAVEPRLLVQRLELARARLLCPVIYKHGQVYVASTSHIWCLHLVPAHQQLAPLLKDKHFQLAIQLAVSVVPGLYSVKQLVRKQVGFSYKNDQLSSQRSEEIIVCHFQRHLPTRLYYERAFKLSIIQTKTSLDSFFVPSHFTTDKEPTVFFLQVESSKKTLKAFHENIFHDILNFNIYSSSYGKRLSFVRADR